MSIEKPQIVLDFDGVLHSYTSGWQGISEIPDLPVSGTQAFLEKALQHFRIAVFSQRSKAAAGRIAMQCWVAHHMGEDLAQQLTFPAEKPICLVTIDDRVLPFTGSWPSIERIKNFKSWQGR
jgi:hypothetical protein